MWDKKYLVIPAIATALLAAVLPAGCEIGTAWQYKENVDEMTDKVIHEASVENADPDNTGYIKVQCDAAAKSLQILASPGFQLVSLPKAASFADMIAASTAIKAASHVQYRVDKEDAVSRDWPSFVPGGLGVRIDRTRDAGRFARSLIGRERVIMQFSTMQGPTRRTFSLSSAGGAINKVLEPCGETAAQYDARKLAQQEENRRKKEVADKHRKKYLADLERARKESIARQKEAREKARKAEAARKEGIARQKAEAARRLKEMKERQAADAKRKAEAIAERKRQQSIHRERARRGVQTWQEQLNSR